jgi:hypothetical protein
MARIRSSAKVTGFVLALKSRFSREFYYKNPNTGPQQDTCGHPLLTDFCSLMLLDDRIAVC